MRYGLSDKARQDQWFSGVIGEEFRGRKAGGGVYRPVK
jgi:hypothetical protein